MFGAVAEPVDQALEREREACRREIRAICEERSRLAQRLTQLVREADDRGDYAAAGCSSSAAWLAQISSSDYRTAAQITRTGAALRELPALDHALETGALSLDQVAAAAKFATPATEREIARAAIGRAPREVGRVARTLAAPSAAHDEELYRRRELRMVWTRGHRELAISGRLPLEQGVVFEQAIRDIAKEQRTLDKRDGVEQEWQQSAADALVSLVQTAGASAGASPTRSRTTLIVHVADGEPPFIEGAGPISPETAERLTCDARRLTIKLQGRDLVHSRVTRCASYAQLRALHRRDRHCRYPGCTATLALQAHHLTPDELGGKTLIDNLVLICPRHHRRMHDHHIRTSGRGEQPVFTDEAGRIITAAQPHAPPG
jgi:5-methylcytosine-specific restriction endonuclease McrA